jgi:DNA-directed RNA polymerase subunit RPC12/RpoP
MCRAHAIVCLEGDAPDGAVKEVVDTLLGGREGSGRIRCPKCRWEPRKVDRWYCSKCQRGVWNTFDTRGVCPVCAYQWVWTACLKCSAWSLHEEWYERPSTG